MSGSNRFQALQEIEEQEYSEAPNPVTEIMDEHQPQSGQEGWESDVDFQDLSDEEDLTDIVVIEEAQRRRKVSSGPRPAHVPNMTFALDPMPTKSIPGMGRGGG
jgi:hypothetical protein